MLIIYKLCICFYNTNRICVIHIYLYIQSHVVYALYKTSMYIYLNSHFKISAKSVAS
jgi:hypothetical protein